MPKPNAKEIYIAGLIILIGIIYLVAQSDALFSIGSTSIRGDSIQLSKNEMFSHIRTILTIVICFSGGILLLKIKKAGWILSLTILLLLFSIASGISISNWKQLSVIAIVLISGGIFLLLLGIILLLRKDCTQKFVITRKNYLTVFILFATLSAFYFLLQ